MRTMTAIRENGVMLGTPEHDPVPTGDRLRDSTSTIHAKWSPTHEL
jgi:hypothetical protein